MMQKIEESASIVLPAARLALARGNIEFIRYELNELLQVFRINLDPNCLDYRKLALAVLRAQVLALEAALARNQVEAAAQYRIVRGAKAQFSAVLPGSGGLAQVLIGRQAGAELGSP